jgi:beta-glucanase (GH16 family)
MEFLSSQFIPENKTYPVNLVLQSEQSLAQGFNAAGTGNFIVANLPFDPTDGFHEYRIDFVPGNVVFYADGSILAKMNTTAVPTMPGHLELTQWSNGNPLWSFGPPPTEATITLSYVKAYFNSSDPERQSALISRCKDPTASGALCVIPDQIGAPVPPPNAQQANSSVPPTYFFSDDHNKTQNQTIYHKNGAEGVSWSGLIMSLFILLLSALMFL